MDYTTPPPPPGYGQVPPLPPKKKGLPGLAWAGIGCGSVIVLGIVIMAIGFFTVGRKVMKKMDEHPGHDAAVVTLNASPDLEKVSEDLKTGQITVRPKAGGADLPTTYDDLVLGKNPVPAAGDLAKVPVWLPPFPGAADVSVMAQEDQPSVSKGIVVFTTTQSDEAVMAFYTKAMSTLSSSNASANSFSNFNNKISRHFSIRSGKQSISVEAFSTDGKPLIVQISYEEKK